MKITALYAGLLTPLFIWLSVMVIRQRRGSRVSLGDGGDPALLRKMRVQANFGEYVPLALILLALAESLGSPPWLLHSLGIALVIGRVAHAMGLSRASEDFRLRVVGVSLTMTVLAVAAAACVWGSIARILVLGF